MNKVNHVMKIAYTLAMLLAVILITTSTGCAQPASEPNNVSDFIHNLLGEWIGTYVQFTDGKQADTKYFHAVIKQLDTDVYQTMFDYYRLNGQTGVPIKVGDSTMTTRIASDGTASNHIIGTGHVLIDPKTLKPEQHDLSEVLRVSPSGGLQGSGSGHITVSGLAFGMGKDGQVNDYHSAWTMQEGALKISQELKVSFRVLLFTKSFTITAEFTGNRGSDIGELMKRAAAKGPAAESDALPLH